VCSRTVYHSCTVAWLSLVQSVYYPDVLRGIEESGLDVDSCAWPCIDDLGLWVAKVSW